MKIYKEVVLKGDNKPTQTLGVYVCHDIGDTDYLFFVHNCCIAKETQLIADFIGVENTGEFTCMLYSQNSTAGLKSYLKSLGYGKLSKLTKSELKNLVYCRFSTLSK